MMGAQPRHFIDPLEVRLSDRNFDTQVQKQHHNFVNSTVASNFFDGIKEVGTNYIHSMRNSQLDGQDYPMSSFEGPKITRE